MRIRHRKTGMEADMPEWEAVPEARYRDVTAECTAVNERSCIILSGHGREIDIRDGYRLRKVVKPCLKDGVLQDYASFIIEKRES